MRMNKNFRELEYEIEALIHDMYKVCLRERNYENLLNDLGSMNNLLKDRIKIMEKIYVDSTEEIL